MDASAIRFRPVAAGDLALLAQWLAAPHVRPWWGDPDEELGLIRDMIEGRDSTRPYLILLDHRPVGYIQVWFLGDWQTETWIADHPWLAAFPADAVGVDLSIGEPALVSRGLGSSALRRFAEQLVGEGHRTIIIDPDPANARAVGAYRKAGFRPVPALEERTEGVLIMQFEPDHAAAS